MKKFSKQKIVDTYVELYYTYAKKYGKVALLYQNGGFYEIYGVENDEVILGNVSLICEEIQLTKSRANKKILENSKDNPLQIGFPILSLDSYVKKFIDHQYTIVVYSQTIREEDDKIIRVLDKIISPSTYTDIDEEDSANLVSVYVEKTKSNVIASVVNLDTTTGSCNCYYFGGTLNDVERHTSKLLRTLHTPKEILFIGEEKLDIALNAIKHNIVPDKVFFRPSYQNEFLSKIFSTQRTGQLSPIEYLNLEKYQSIVVSLIVALNFADEHDPSIIKKISKPKIHLDADSQLYMSHKTMSQLNVVSERSVKSLYDIINKASTIGGKRMLKKRLLTPITDVDILNKRYNEVETLDYKKYSELLKDISDLDRLHGRIFTGKLHPYELLILDTSYVNILKILSGDYPCNKSIDTKNIIKFKEFVDFYNYNIQLKKLSVTERKFYQDTINENIFYKNNDIDTIKRNLDDSWQNLNDYALEISKYIDKKQNLIKIEETATEGYYFSTTKTRFNSLMNAASGKYNFEVKSNTNNVKIFDSKIKKISNSIISLTKSLKDANKNKFIDFLQEITTKYQTCLKNIANYISYVDVVNASKKVAVLYNYCKPKILCSGTISFIKTKNLRHPILERISQEEFVPNDFELGDSGMLLYGINGVGKSIGLLSVGLATILVQAGFYAPATSFEYYPYKTLITKISMSDDLYKNQSTFTCEMLDLRDMLEMGDHNALILADELCSGTETNSAISLVSASILALSKKKASFLFTTHLHQLKEVEEIKSLTNVKFYHLSIEIKNGVIIYGRKLKSGTGESTYGIEIASQLKVGDSEFIKNAISIRKKIEGEALEILSTKQSRYNPDVYIHCCAKCGATENLETDHIKPQCKADENNMIGGYHKNSKYNLMVLCKRCHLKKTKNDR